MKVDPGNGVNFLIMRTFQTLFILLALCGCGRRQPAPETVRPVKVVTASGAGVIDKDFAGMATPDDAVNLAFKLPGQVLDVPVSQGESVKKGALLAELDPRDIQLQVSADRSAYEEARSQLQRMQRLLEHEAVSQQEFEASRTRYAQARSAYDNSLDMLKETKLRAPFASVVERKYVEEGGGMNVMFKINGTVVTPALTGSILRGVTRKSAIELLKSWGVPVEERLLSVDELFDAAASGALEEAWCIGTAAVISPIGELSWGDRDYKVNDNKIGALSQKLYDELTGIQWGTKPDPFGWVCPID